MAIEVSLSALGTFTVGAADTARAVGSGDVPVLGTPRLIAWAEAVTVRALAPHLDAGATSLGTRIELDHLAASPVGTEVSMQADLTAVDGRSLTFTIRAWQDEDSAIARGTVTRVIVDRERFLSRLRAEGADRTEPDADQRDTAGAASDSVGSPPV